MPKKLSFFFIDKWLLVLLSEGLRFMSLEELLATAEVFNYSRFSMFRLLFIAAYIYLNLLSLFLS